MIDLLLWLFFVACVGTVAAWMSENPGHVTIVWFDYLIEIKFVVLLALVAVASLILAYTIILVRKIMLAPRQISDRRKIRHYKKGLEALTHSVAALAASDAKAADKQTKKAIKYLGHTPLTLLLSAQVSRSGGDERQTRALLEQMLDHKETEFLAARSLSDAARKQRQYAKALTLARRAQSVNPKAPASSASVVSLHLHLGQWQEALMAIRQGPRGERKRQEGLVHLLHGQQLFESGQAESALSHAKQALKLLPGFVPATLLAARAYNANNQPKKAVKIILAGWRQSPHPELAEVLRIVTAREPKAKQLAYAKKLKALAPNDVESELAVAETAIKQQDWETARAALKTALAKEETVRACKLMAYAEQGEFSDYDAAGRWLSKSAEAAADAAWACSHCAHASEHWSVHCPACGAFDTVAWKAPSVAIAEAA